MFIFRLLYLTNSHKSCLTCIVPYRAKSNLYHLTFVFNTLYNELPRISSFFHFVLVKHDYEWRKLKGKLLIIQVSFKIHSRLSSIKLLTYSVRSIQVDLQCTRRGFTNKLAYKDFSRLGTGLERGKHCSNTRTKRRTHIYMHATAVIWPGAVFGYDFIL